MKGKIFTIIGRGYTVGKPLREIVEKKEVGGTATICHTQTPLAEKIDFVKKGDILVAAADKPWIIDNGGWIKEGAVIIDAGNFPNPSGKGRRGCVKYEAVENIAGAVTPVPGGVGPWTNTILVYHLLQSAYNKLNVGSSQRYILE